MPVSDAMARPSPAAASLARLPRWALAVGDLPRWGFSHEIVTIQCSLGVPIYGTPFFCWIIGWTYRQCTYFPWALWNPKHFEMVQKFDLFRDHLQNDFHQISPPCDVTRTTCGRSAGLWLTRNHRNSWVMFPLNTWTSTMGQVSLYLPNQLNNQFSDFGMTWNTNVCSWLSGYRKFILDDLGGQNPGGCEHLNLWRCSSPQRFSYRQLVWTHPVLKPVNHGPVANHSGSFLFFNHKNSR